MNVDEFFEIEDIKNGRPQPFIYQKGRPTTPDPIGRDWVKIDKDRLEDHPHIAWIESL